jgi:hypothetical protein
MGLRCDFAAHLCLGSNLRELARNAESGRDCSTKSTLRPLSDGSITTYRALSAPTHRALHRALHLTHPHSSDHSDDDNDDNDNDNDDVETMERN